MSHELQRARGGSFVTVASVLQVIVVQSRSRHPSGAAGSHPPPDTLIPLIWPCGWRSDIIRLHCKRPSGTGCCFWGEANFDSKPFSVRISVARRAAAAIAFERLAHARARAFLEDFYPQMTRGVTLLCVCSPVFPFAGG